MKVPMDPSLAQSLHLPGSPAEQVARLFEYMRHRGHSFYDEAVTQLEHALQCAYQAQLHQGTPEQITSALLHDIGHFLSEEQNEASTFLTEDWHHESVGAAYLKPFFSEAVTEPIRLHVAAKRYLCTTDPDYFKGLSQASQRSFLLQGNILSAEALSAFENHPHFETAVLLRRWDDAAKIQGWNVPGLDTYREKIESCWLARTG